MTHHKEEMAAEGILIKNLEEPEFLGEMRGIVDDFFKLPTSKYVSMDRESFQELALDCQRHLNKIGVQERFYKSERNFFDRVFESEKLLFESVIFFRAVRPLQDGVLQENPDFHRESMYSDHEHTRHVLNVWCPLKNVEEKNTLKYVPKSHLIPDSELLVEVNESTPSKVKKHSAGHGLGFLWKPKQITSGVNLNSAVNMNFKENDYAIFSSMLVHGGGDNNSDKIRFAFGFGVIPENKMGFNKSFFASGGKPHYMAF